MFSLPIMHWTQILVYFFIIAGAATAAMTRKLTVAGACVGAIVAIVIYYAVGVPGLSMLAAFFVMGVATTSLKRETKQKLSAEEQDPRTAAQVVANGGLAAIVCILSWIFPAIENVLPLLIAAVFSAASADTVSSEMGNAYGTKFYHILTGRPGTKGTNGVVSIEGTLFGLLGSTVIAVVYGIGYKDYSYTLHILIAGTIGNFADSCFGIIENKGLINNNAVNFLNTLIAVLVIGITIWMTH